MAGRKITNPQRIDVESNAMSFSFYQHIPRQRQRTTGSGVLQIQNGGVNCDQKISLPETNAEINDESLTKSIATRKRKRKSKRAVVKVTYKPTLRNSPSVFASPTISENTILSFPIVQIPDHPPKYSIPILHSYTPGQEAFQIQFSRDEHPSNCICIGKVCVSLNGDIPLNKLFLECGISLKLSLEFFAAAPPLLKIADGTQFVYVCVSEITPPLKMDVCGLLSGKKCMRLMAVPISEDTSPLVIVNELVVEVWAMESLCTVAGPSEVVKCSSQINDVRQLVKTLHPGCLDTCDTRNVGSIYVSVSDSINNFYKEVQTKQSNKSPVQSPTVTISPFGLSATLRGYQCKAVNWMIGKEVVSECKPGGACDRSGESDGCDGEGVHKLWWRLPTTDEEVYFNSFSGKFSRQRFPVAPWPKGGILADEMGLGKTVEILALILAHPWPGEKSKNGSNSNSTSVEVESIEQSAVGEKTKNGSSSSVEVESIDQSAVGEKTKNGSNSSVEVESIEQSAAVGEKTKLHSADIKGTDSEKSCTYVQHKELFTELAAHEGNKIFEVPSGTNDIARMETDVTLDDDASLPHAHRPQEKRPAVCIKEIDSPSEVIQCLCGAISDHGYEGEFVQCELCLVWFHSICVDYSFQRHGEHFYCVRCLLEKPLPCGATLIISPQAIVQQWMDEISKHTQPGVISAYMYQGISRGRCVSPLELARYDIVVVSYETLCKEFYYAVSHEMSKSLRKRKRYYYSPSPLPALLWWRVSLDEAQMVESTNVRAAEMTKKLSAVNRWCVTGTPVQRQLLDLYGLLLFLKVDPYLHSSWFSRLLWEPYLNGNSCPMVELFAEVMWRNSKADVASELCLPGHSEEVHWLQFSSVEAYFYQRQQGKCHTDLENVIRGLAPGCTLSSLEQATFHKLMTPLHTLRQACCHPQLIRSGSYLPASMTNKSYITMPRLLEKLTSQAKVEAREALRVMIAALNGLAGIFIIQNELFTASTCYRRAMTAWQEHQSHDIDCDKLQRIHTMENLAELLQHGLAGDEHSPRDSTLMEEAGALRSQYTEKVESQVKAAAEGLFVTKNNIDLAQSECNWMQACFLEEIPSELLEEIVMASDGQSTAEGVGTKSIAQNETDTDTTACESDQVVKPTELSETEALGKPSQIERSDLSDDLATESSPVKKKTLTEVKKPRPQITPSQPWWVSVCKWLCEHGLDEELVAAVKVECEQGTKALAKSIPRFSDLRGISYYITDHADKTQSTRQCVLSLLDDVCTSPISRLIDHASPCHLRPEPDSDSNRDEILCPLCVTESKTISYERQLFSDYERDKWADQTSHEHGGGSRKPGLMERIIKTLSSFTNRQKGFPKKLRESGQSFLSYIEETKKEYTAIRSLWLALDRRLRVHDELDMASTRLRKMTWEEVYSGKEISFAIHPYQVSQNMYQFDSEKDVAERDLKKCVGQVLYLKNLATNKRVEETCPVCSQALHREWAVFSCGHPLCVDCTSSLIQQQPHYQPCVTVKCPLCREPSRLSSVNYVREGLEEGYQEDIPIQGCYSTKVAAVVRTLLHIQKSEPGSKCLVFSAWLDVLDIIAAALGVNNVDYRFLKARKTFQENLAHFKSSPDTNILLLPFNSGSKGLNIVEASHVLLVEPLLEFGAELQAIGRVHRMGQTRPTKVHRFLVSKTVEEKIHAILKSRPDKCRREKESELTLSDIRDMVELHVL